ncbi:MAG: NAD(P)/FAD-dependent oxidoreductase [Candidatus Nanoarchaeia archaeon]|jgi:hypothetical protein|nr:NAD(P)/FAD-dependent oxidoreductase [Candidatus Nanoarchaeia archaeon]
MKIILGSGIAGLIWAKYHSDHFILTDQVGGQMMSYFDMGPRYLHDTKQSRMFLKDLDVPLKLSTIKVGYIDDSGWVLNPSVEFRQKYFMKSRGRNNLVGFDSTVLNSNKKEFQICNIKFNDIILKLFDVLSERIYYGKVEKIDLQEHKVFADTMSFKYEKIVSTIPLNVFSKIAGLNLELKSFDTFYCLLSHDFFDLREYDFVYDARLNSPFHRMTKSKQGIVCDILGSKINEFKEVVYKEYLILPEKMSFKTIKNGQIISLDKDFELQDRPEVRFVGRFGSWSRRWKTETVIEEAIKNV